MGQETAVQPLTRRQKAAAVLVAMRRKPYARPNNSVFEECGCCGSFHRKGFTGDCRDNSERFDNPPAHSRVIYLEDKPSIWIGAFNARRRRIARERRHHGQLPLYQETA